MGCDGGTIPRRDELVRTQKKPEQKDKAAELAFRWNCCTISQHPLQKPIVACGLGRLYSKMSVLESLLDKKNFPDIASHIKSLKDVKDLNLTPNPAYKEGSVEKGDGVGDRGCSPFICPVIGLEMNGRFGFVFLWSCGCVFSERALKEVKTSTCHKCQKPFTEEDVVVLNPAGDDLDRAVVRMEARRAKEKATKGKKRKNGATTSEQESAEAGPSKLIKEIKKEPEESTSSDSNESTKQLENPVTVKTEPKVSAGPSKPTGSKLATSKVSNGVAGSSHQGKGLVDPKMKKALNGYRVSKDPNASEVYKSLFTSHKAAKQQTKAHWVTYNPFYN